MHKRILSLVSLCLCCQAGQITLKAQEFEVLDRTVQIHGFVSQGFVYTNNNNWLTMNTSQGSAGFTDFGLNMSSQVTDKFRVGRKGYDRNLGQLGQYHPSLDWAVADYRFKGWFGVRGGKVKTTLGLYTDTQDEDFLHTFALLPQRPIRPISAMRPLLIWARISTGKFHSDAGSEYLPTRRISGTAATASIAAILIT